MPASSASEDVVMRLILKGQEPAEAARFARMGIDAVRAEYQAGTQKIQAAFAASHQAQTAEAQKAAKAQIREAQAATKAIVQALKEVEREQAKITGTMKSNWRRTLEDMENVTIVVGGLIGAFQTMAGSAKHFGDEIIRTTNIFQSLTGSIEEARAATDGTVSDMELITAKNAAMVGGLELSGKQFGEVAALADAYADAVGISAKEALDPFINSIVSGNEKMLKRLGIVIDNTKVEKIYAGVLETTADKLSEQEKKAAFTADALRQITVKAKELNAQPPTFATLIEQSFVGAKNAWDRMVASIGSFQIPGPLNDMISKLGAFANAYEKNSNRALGALPGGGIVRAAQAAYNMSTGTAEVDAQIDAARKQGNQKFARNLTAEADDAEPDFLKKGKTKPSKLKQETITYVSPDTVTGLDRLLYKAAIVQQDEIAKIASDAWDQALTDRRQDATDFSASKGIDAQAFLDREDLKEQAKIPLAKAMAMSDKNEQGAVIEPWVLDLKAAVEASREKAGGGLVGQLLFGDDTNLDQTYDKLSRSKQAVIDTFKEMSDFAAEAGGAMAGALGSSLAAAIGEGKNTLKAQTHAVMMGISQQAFTHALMEGALGLAALAMQDYPSAAMHGAAAAAFGAVGLAAGGAARATYSAPSSAPAVSSRSAPSYASGGGGGSSGGGGGDTTMVFNINGMIGDSEAIVRAIGRGVDEYRRKTGRDPWGNN